MKIRNIILIMLSGAITGCHLQWSNPFYPYFTDNHETAYTPLAAGWVKREEQVQMFAVNPLTQQLFFITDQNHYIFPIDSKLTAVLQMPQRNSLDIATHGFEQIGDLIKGNLTLSLRPRDTGDLDAQTLSQMGFKRSIEPNLGDVWKLNLYLVGKIYQGITDIPSQLRLSRPYNVQIYQKEAYNRKSHDASPIKNFAAPLFLLTVPIWFTGNKELSEKINKK